MARRMDRGQGRRAEADLITIAERAPLDAVDVLISCPDILGKDCLGMRGRDCGNAG